MTTLDPQNGFLFMKVGTHAKESLADIIARKTKEIHDCGFAMWGYGGNTCHPATMVQPFAQAVAARSGRIYLCMQEINSQHFAEPVRATEYSKDGIDWRIVPEQINVLGSRFALVINEFRQEQVDLPLHLSAVAVGNSKGRPGNRYIQGHVDKACLEILGSRKQELQSDEEKIITTSLVAELTPPYAVFLRNPLK